MTDHPGTESDGPFDYARAHPVALVAGLAVGVLAALVMVAVFWFAVPVAPLLVCLATLFTRRTQAFSVGALAATVGVWTFLILLGILMMASSAI